MVRVLKFTLIGLVLISLLGGVGFWYWAESRTALPSADALADLVSDAQVTISDGDNLIFRPASGQPPRTGVIFYPGANADIRGYTSVLRRVAEEGYLVVAARMPFNMAMFAPDRATAVMQANPGIERWVIIGHSMGGAFASMYTGHHPENVDGLIVWDSYPTEGANLQSKGVPVWHIHRALPDGSAPEKFTNLRSRFPADSVWVPIPGGNHMNFGGFEGGGYVEQWAASISRSEQHALVSRATLAALRAMDAS